MAISDRLRKAIVASGETHYAIGQATGIDTRALDRFVQKKKHIRTDTADALAEYLGLELRPRKAKAASKRRKSAVE